MSLFGRLRERRCDIVKRWTDEALGSHTPRSENLQRKARDPFADPMGSTISAEIGFLFDALVRATPPTELSPHLNRILEIKCVQDGPYSAAVAFIFRLKEVIRDELASCSRDPRFLEELLEFGDRVDRLALTAFECHSHIQRRIADLRVREAKARVAGLLRMTKVEWNELPACVPVREEQPGDRGR